MIRFSETNEHKSDVQEASNAEKIGKIDINYARGFWDRLFENKKGDNLLSELSEDEIRSKVYGRDETEFDFHDLNINPENLRDMLNGFKPEIWNETSEVEKDAIIENFKNRLTNEFGIKNIPDIKYYDANSDDCGAFDTENNCIEINRANFNNPNEVLNTIAHETCHAYQNQRAEHPVTEKDYLYAYNFEHYITPYYFGKGYTSFFDYHDQLVEAEARAFASKVEEWRDE